MPEATMCLRNSSSTPKVTGLGIDDWRTLVTGSYYFVDKTLLIKEFLDSGNLCTLITRPRRFGKTLNMSMLYSFFSNENAKSNRALFVGKKIQDAKTILGKNCMDYQGQFPVVFFTFSSVEADTIQEAKIMMASRMSLVYRQYAYLMNSDKLSDDDKATYQRICKKEASDIELGDSLCYLSMYLRLYFDKKVIILIDEFDKLFNSAYTSNPKFVDELRVFMRKFLGAAFKGNNNLYRVFLTGVLQVTAGNLASGFNNVVIESILSEPYSEHFGFTEDEAANIIRAHTENKPDVDVNHVIEVAREWYNGYQFGNINVYNPWSLLSYVHYSFKPKEYWIQTGDSSILDEKLFSIRSAAIKDLISLGNNETVSTQINERVSFGDIDTAAHKVAVYSFMLHAGYLKLDSEYGSRYKVAIPNLEVKCALHKMAERWFGQLGGNHYSLSEGFQEGDLEKIYNIIEIFLSVNISCHDLGKKTHEKYYHVLMLGLVLGMDNNYKVSSNKEMADGRYDILLIPREHLSIPGYILEFKSTESVRNLEREAQKGLEQISTKQYSKAFRDNNVEHAYEVGMAFSGKRIVMAYKKLGDTEITWFGRGAEKTQQPMKKRKRASASGKQG